MSYANVADICHDFWYASKQESGRHNNVSYNGRFFYSYSTVIGVKLQYKGAGRDICMVSSNSMTTTTAKHRSHLVRACPKIVEYIPLEYGDNFYSERDFLDCMYKRIVTHITESTDADLKQAPKRLDLLQDVYLLNMFCENFDVPKTTKKLKEKCAHIEMLGREIEERNQLIQEKRRESRKEREYANWQKREAERSAVLVEVEECIKRSSYLEVLRGCFGQIKSCPFPVERRKDFKDAIKGDSVCSYVWLEGEFVKTSQSVTLPITIVHRALRQWREGLLKTGNSIGSYSVREISEDAVQIGCHRIPMRNILELEKAIMS